MYYWNELPLSCHPPLLEPPAGAAAAAVAETGSSHQGDMLPAAAQQQMLERSLDPVLQTLIRLEEKVDRIEEKVDALTLQMQARGLDDPPAAQLGWPPAEGGEAHAAPGAAPWYGYRHDDWWSGRSGRHAQYQTAQASTWTP